MKKITLMSTIFITCTLYNCNKNPEACFKVVSQNPTAGVPVKFLNCSEFGRGTAFWNFGDATDILRNQVSEIEHTFNNVGTYNVVLEVFQSGKSSTYSFLLTVN